jgi:hypothetical protein
LAVIQTDHPIDLRSTDIRLGPDVGAGLMHVGLELAQQAVELRAELRVLYATGYGIMVGMKAMFVPGSGFLPKPDDINHLIAALADGYIAMVATKNHYGYWRPVTANRTGETDGNPRHDREPGVACPSDGCRGLAAAGRFRGHGWGAGSEITDVCRPRRAGRDRSAAGSANAMARGCGSQPGLL